LFFEAFSEQIRGLEKTASDHGRKQEHPLADDGHKKTGETAYA